METKKLNLGAGRDIKDGYINTDIIKFPGIDIAFDFNKFPFPFKDNTFDEVTIQSSIHCTNNLLKFMEEIYRISKPNATIKILSEFFLSTESANDPNGKTKIGYNTFNIFNRIEKEVHGENLYTKAQFEIIKRKWIFSENKYLNFLNFIPNIFPKIYGRFFYFFFPSNKLYFELRVMK